MWKLLKISISLCLSFLMISPVFAEQGEPSAYRMKDYRGEVPMTVRGARVIETAQELQNFLIQSDHVILLDVYPAPRKPDNFPQGDLWIEPKRQTLPDAIWLANTGMGILSDALEKLFKQQLAQLSQGDKNHNIIIFCEPECWHSWNAAKRAVSYGYVNIHWYRQGVAGWKKENFPLITKQPVRP